MGTRGVRTLPQYQNAGEDNVIATIIHGKNSICSYARTVVVTLLLSAVPLLVPNFDGLLLTVVVEIFNASHTRRLWPLSRESAHVETCFQERRRGQPLHAERWCVHCCANVTSGDGRNWERLKPFRWV